MSKSAAELIGNYVGWDMQEVNSNKYQPGQYSCSVFTIGNDYYCCPPHGQKPPKEFEWKLVSSTLSTKGRVREIYFSRMVGEEF